MNIQRVKQGALITYYNGLYMILIGLFYILFNRLTMTWNFLAISELWGFFARFNPRISFLFFLFNILIGIFHISEGVVIMYLSDFIFKRKEKMTWVVLFLSGIICWGGLLTVSILSRNLVWISLSSIGWISFIIGMILPLRYYLEKNYREY